MVRSGVPGPHCQLYAPNAFRDVSTRARYISRSGRRRESSIPRFMAVNPALIVLYMAASPF